MVDPKRDMVQTPIDADEEPAVPPPVVQSPTECEIGDHQLTEAERQKGFIIIAYKTMEDMDTEEFRQAWKTWTGVRYLCTQLPRQLGLRRIAFYRRLTPTGVFTVEIQK